MAVVAGHAVKDREEDALSVGAGAITREDTLLGNIAAQAVANRPPDVVREFDITPEDFTLRLAANGGVLACLAAEATILDSVGRYVERGRPTFRCRGRRYRLAISSFSRSV